MPTAEGDSGSDLSAIFEAALNDIYKELVDVKTDIQPDLFGITEKSINKALDKAFPSIDYESPDWEFYNALKHSNAVFSAFKTHRQQNDLAKLMLDADGNLKSFNDFKNDAMQILGDYNVNWLKTEYDTAVIRSQMAARFREFERDADLYPNLKWMPSTSAVKREAHVKLYGLILPLDDPFWLKMYPGSDWNCKCGITNTDDEPNGDKYGIDDLPPVPKGLEGNPAKTKALFSPAHPYRANAYKGAAKAVKKFVK